MRIRAIILGLILLGQLSCTNDDFGDVSSFKDDTSITTLNGTWKVNSFEDFSTGKVEGKTQENSWDKDIIIKFDDTKDPHEFSGTNTTNAIFGKFEYIGTRKFKVIEFGTTEVAQPAWANKFNQALSDGELNFEINVTGLRIYYDNKTKSVTLTKE